MAAKAGVAAPARHTAQAAIPLAVSGLGAESGSSVSSPTSTRPAVVHAYAAGRVRPKANAVPRARPQAGGNFAAAAVLR